jgi:hypothetical protein
MRTEILVKFKPFIHLIGSRTHDIPACSIALTSTCPHTYLNTNIYLRLGYVFMVYLTRLSVAQLIEPQLLGWLVNGELRRIWKDAVVALYKVPVQHLPWETEANHAIPRSDPATSQVGNIQCALHGMLLGWLQGRWTEHVACVEKCLCEAARTWCWALTFIQRGH